MPRKEFLWLAAGVALAMIFQNQISTFANPILASVKLTYP